MTPPDLVYQRNKELLREVAVLREALGQAVDAMEQALDHATDGTVTGIPEKFPEDETIGQRERLTYLPLNELDGIRMALPVCRRAINSPPSDGPPYPDGAPDYCKHKRHRTEQCPECTSDSGARFQSDPEFTRAISRPNDVPADRTSLAGPGQAVKWSCPATPLGCHHMAECRRDGWCHVAGEIERINFQIVPARGGES